MALQRRKRKNSGTQQENRRTESLPPLAQGLTADRWPEARQRGWHAVAAGTVGSTRIRVKIKTDGLKHRGE